MAQEVQIGLTRFIPSSRTPTLESNQPNTGRGNLFVRSLLTLQTWFKAQLKDDDTLNDSIEALIEGKISRLVKSKDSESASRRIQLKRCLKDYAWVKDRPGYELGSDLLQTWLICDGTDANSIKSQVDTFSLQPPVTFSEFTGQLLTHFSKRHPESLRIIAMTERPDPAHDRTFLTAQHKIRAAIGAPLRTLSLVPGRIIGLLVRETFDIDLALLNNSTPSVKDARRMAFSVARSRPLRANFDPDRLEDDCINLRWERHAFPFESDIDVYMQEPHRSMSCTRGAVLCFSPAPSANASKSDNVVLISFDHYSSLRSFAGMTEQLLQDQTGVSISGQRWCIESNVLLLIYSLLALIVADTVNFLQECSVQLELMGLRARHSPSSNKLRYLLYLKDSRRMASEAVDHAARILHTIKTWKGAQPDASQIWDGGVAWSVRATRLSNELGFLRRQLQKIDAEIRDLQYLLRERLELAHDRRSFVLALVAAIYLPLSLATSFFGMNINAATSPSGSGFSNYTSDWIAHSPTKYQNATRAIVSSIGTSGTLTYSWKIFAITAGVLLLTLPLSLTLGSITRSLYRSVMRYARYWRVIAIPSLFAFFVFSAVSPEVIPVWMPYYAWAPFIACNSLFTLYAGYSLHTAWRRAPAGHHGADLFYWAFMSAIIPVCFLVTLLTDTSTSPTFIPWIFMLLKWFVPWMKARRRRIGRWL